ncbi:MAG: DUF3365 domain-containing protein [Betaproteobacteria bacterium]|nr:DUF3365 domain-containing protein [Betaproteobacteria bacterium]
MGLRLKFNVVLLVVFALGLGISGTVSYRLLHRTAEEEVLRNAGVMMVAALAMRAYTVEDVRAKLRKVDGEFLKESVPAFAAHEIMRRLRATYADYSYKEATLNPTNPADRAVDWEADIVNAFRNDGSRREISGVRDTELGPSLYLARPLRVNDAACLSCHSVPDSAPPAMVRLYGPGNGFGWSKGEVIGAQIVSVPMTLPVRNANRVFLTFMGSLAAIFVVLFVILNVMLSLLIVRPVTRMSAAADRVSMGETDIPEFDETGRDEMSLLGQSFNRMRRSLEKAMRMIGE